VPSEGFQLLAMECTPVAIMNSVSGDDSGAANALTFSKQRRKMAVVNVIIVVTLCCISDAWRRTRFLFWGVVEVFAFILSSVRIYG